MLVRTRGGGGKSNKFPRLVGRHRPILLPCPTSKYLQVSKLLLFEDPVFKYCAHLSDIHRLVRCPTSEPAALFGGQDSRTKLMDRVRWGRNGHRCGWPLKRGHRQRVN